MSVKYPASQLPLPRYAYGLEEQNTTIRTLMEGGRARQRNWHNHSLKMFKVTWVFTLEEFLVWRMFHREAIGFGSSYFDMELLIENVPKEYECRIVQGTYSDKHTAGGMHHVEATIEVEELELPLEGLYSIFEAIAPDKDYWAFLDTLSNYHNAIHVDYYEMNQPIT